MAKTALARFDTERLSTKVTQEGHTFSVGQVIKYNAGTSEWELALANTDANLGRAVVVKVSGNTFEAAFAGKYTLSSPHGLTLGTQYYLSSSTPGELTSTAPTLIQKVIYPLTSTQILVKLEGVTTEGVSSSSTETLDVTQSLHGFNVLDAIRHNGSEWVKALADSPSTLADGIVISVSGLNSFTVARSGFYSLSAHGLTPLGDWFFLSDSGEGDLTSTPPSQYIQPLLKVLDANSISIHNSVGSLAASGSGSGGTSSAEADTERLSTSVTQTGHSFVLGNIVRYNTASSEWELALADTESNLGQAIVVKVSGDTFEAAFAGKYTLAAPHGLTLGSQYYLSESVAGQLTTTAPTLVQKVLYPLDSTQVLVKFEGLTAERLEISQSLHGFNVLDAIRHNGSEWVKALADSPSTLADGIVISVSGLNSFTVARSGFYNIASHGLTPLGDWFFLSDSGEGDLTSTPPSQYIQPLLKVLDANSISIHNSVGSLAASGSGSGGSSPLNLSSIQNLRLTLESGKPIMADPVLAATTLYLTPYLGDNISLYNGTSWDLLSTDEVSLDLSLLAANANFDIFAYNNTGNVTLEALEWDTSGEGTSTRSVELVYQNGVLVKTGALTRRYLGTIRTSAAGECEFSFGGFSPSATEAKLYVWNYYNRVSFKAYLGSSSANWTLTPPVNYYYRAANNSDSFRVSFIQGAVEDSFSSEYIIAGMSPGSLTTIANAIGLNSTTSFVSSSVANTPSAAIVPLVTKANIKAPVGFNFVSAMEGGLTLDQNYVFHSSDGTGGSIYQMGLHFSGLF